jgi:hypothetical protein
LFTADAVHEKATNDAAGQVEAIYDCAVADVLDECVVWVELADYGAGEDAEGVCDARRD